ncbi:type II toxin-antitoxin system RnlB family antitoxin [Clostridium perfringens]|uniref:type II toxin-antitoxin system RnlB family antitoxin n=1 Tax=Clostridium perfringens TaxID=1502 RepID=UPI0010D48902|nr:type II toxin-antitoxin system RnlB family antitoxin [Clostridium perfringens]MBO3395849.1 type II toxin-antitoxin system RnlB family antitoxin [Clostridium perfringens]MBO3402502.1 type II toxin-antitoxin system RnlB family antitoxin [Clostridium perfringens]MDU1476583.1 type II toxin-antitoxin system RnlB family antitoxin [Clostridium perfringens]MDU2827924.1 type II toxin-antitoxin system RnlB family antitoxin [Clostridium perfringens]MDU4419872.1 type II toxin-antitoxin system RnlB fami
MKNYEIVSIDNNEYDVIIYSESRISPFKSIKNIEEDLRKMNLKNKKILFDMILCRGNNLDRFIKCDFDGNSILRDTMEVVRLSKKDVLRKISVEYLSKEKDKIENSILTSIQKRMIIKGISI